ncbi:MAG: FAD-binding oxidoreductase, partial [Candidatus Bathyarchaeia archaeon]
KPKVDIKKPLETRAKEMVDELKDSLGKAKVNDDLPTRITHRFTHGPEVLFHPNLDDLLPAAVVHPRSTEDVKEVIRLANEYCVPVVPQGGRTGTFGAEGIRDCIALDTFSMNRILELNEETMRVTAEAGVRVSDFISYVEERGYMCLEFPTMNRASTLGSRVALSGYNRFYDMWGPSGNYVQAIEVVLPYNAEAYVFGTGSRVPTKSQMGLNIMPLFFGSKGSLGVITKVTEKIIYRPEVIKYGIMGFKTLEDGIKAYIELRKRVGAIWRVKSYNKWFISQAVKSMMGQEWPEDVEQITDFFVVGDKEVVEAMEKKAYEICRQCGGFWRPDMPEPTFIGKMHETMEKYMGMAAIWSERLTKGGAGNRLVPFDPALPDRVLPKFLREFFALLRKIEDGEHYPALATAVKVLEPASPVPASYGWTKVWGSGLLVHWPKVDDEVRKEFMSWFREFAELVWRYGGTLSMTHGQMYIPRDMRVEFIKREVGEKEYEFMKLIKRTLDPNNIMNPYALP